MSMAKNFIHLVVRAQIKGVGNVYLELQYNHRCAKSVMPAKAGIHFGTKDVFVIPAFAGMTN